MDYPICQSFHYIRFLYFLSFLLSCGNIELIFYHFMPNGETELKKSSSNLETGMCLDGPRELNDSISSLLESFLESSWMPVLQFLDVFAVGLKLTGK